MSIHHLDVLRFLFGDPTEIFTAARPDPRTAFAHTDGITVSTLQFPSGLLAISMEDVWSGPRERGLPVRHLHQMAGRGHGRAWRRDDRLARLPARQSLDPALQFAPPTGGAWVEPRWDTMWFPHAFKGVMAQLQDALHDGREPSSSGARQRPDDGAGRGRLPLDEEGRSVKLAEFGY